MIKIVDLYQILEQARQTEICQSVCVPGTMIIPKHDMVEIGM